MSQDEINEAEWRDPGNWSSSFLGVYFSKVDSRTWVPKRPRWAGWTLNLAEPAAIWWLLFLLQLPFFLVVGVLITTETAGG